MLSLSRSLENNKEISHSLKKKYSFVTIDSENDYSSLSKLNNI